MKIEKKSRKKNLSFRERALIWLLFQQGYSAGDIKYFLYEDKNYDISLQRLQNIRTNGLIWSLNETTIKQQQTAYNLAKEDLKIIEESYRTGLRNAINEEISLYNSGKLLIKKRIDEETIDNSSLTRTIMDCFNRISLINGQPTEISKTLNPQNDIKEIPDEQLNEILISIVEKDLDLPNISTKLELSERIDRINMVKGLKNRQKPVKKLAINQKIKMPE